MVLSFLEAYIVKVASPNVPKSKRPELVNWTRVSEHSYIAAKHICLSADLSVCLSVCLSQTYVVSCFKDVLFRQWRPHVKTYKTGQYK